MKNKILIFSIVLGGLLLNLTACSEWTQPEPVQVTEFRSPGNEPFNKYSEAYLRNLREYKKSDHAVFYGWFGNWTAKGSNPSGYLKNLPDSVDIISIWGDWRNLSPEQMADKEFVQKQKGTKILFCFIVQDIGSGVTPERPKDKTYPNIPENQWGMTWTKEFWGWKDGDEAAIEQAIRKYANAICDTIDKYNYDGFDIDYEPGYGHDGSLSTGPSGSSVVKDRMAIFVEEMGKRIGPKSGTGRLFLIDGVPEALRSDVGIYFDYFISQAYASGSNGDLDRRVDRMRHLAGFTSKKYICTENFESYAPTGGVSFTSYNGEKMYSLKGMAYWNPRDGRKGGVGTYHTEYDYPMGGNKTNYHFTREAIQIMNPAVY